LCRYTEDDEDDEDGGESVMSYSTLASTVQSGGGSEAGGGDDIHGGGIMNLLRPPGPRGAGKKSYSTAPIAGPGIRAADLAKLAKELQSRETTPKKDNSAVLEWQSKVGGLHSSTL
jgi:hypothetical protein